jgi:hypothetical protein
MDQRAAVAHIVRVTADHGLARAPTVDIGAANIAVAQTVLYHLDNRTANIAVT